MFFADRWAEAFIDLAGDNADEGVCLLSCFAAAIKNPDNGISGLKQAREAALLIETTLKSAAYTEKHGGLEAARAIIFLLIQKGYLNKITILIREIERLIEINKGILNVRLDMAFAPESAYLDAIKVMLRQKTGVRDINLSVVVIPALLGGFRLMIDGELWDYSLDGKLQQLKRSLTA
jgi:F0F1-type ATP synthase delta subunit